MGSSHSQVTLVSRDSSTWALEAFCDRTQVPFLQASRNELLLRLCDTPSRIVSTRAFITCCAMIVRRYFLTLQIEDQCTWPVMEECGTIFMAIMGHLNSQLNLGKL